MENAICIILLSAFIIVLKIILDVKIKEIKKLNKNEELGNITKKLPSDYTIAKELLEKLDNRNVKIEQAKNTQTSLYIALTNKISIADMKNNYARVQTIAHECIHSCQPRKLLMFNFIFSNITIIYFIISIILTIMGIYTNYLLQIFILTILSFTQFSVRSFLEIDAMTRAEFLAKEYLRGKNEISQDEANKLYKSYKYINKYGIPFVVWNLVTTAFFRVIIYCSITLIYNLV